MPMFGLWVLLVGVADAGDTQQVGPKGVFGGPDALCA
jgi:hypothetical protein